jgi:hypothetical protein
MRLTPCGAVLTALLLCWCPAAWADAIKDRARLFNPGARRQAEEQIQGLETAYGKRVVIETAKPTWLGRLFQRRQLKEMDAATQGRFLDEEAQKRAASVGPHSVFVFFHQDPPFVQMVLSSDPDLDRVLPATARSELRDRVLIQLKQNQPDAALAETVSFLQIHFEAGLSSHAAATPFFNWTPVVWSIASLLALWLVIELAQILTGGRPGGGHAAIGAVHFAGGAFLAGLFAYMARCGGPAAVLRGECRPDAADEDHAVPAGHLHEQP